MSAIQTADETLAPELEAIAAAAAERVHAEARDDRAAAEQAQARVAQAASAAIAAGAGLGPAAEAEQAGQARSRQALGQDLLRRIKKVTQRRGEAERDYNDAIRLAGRIGIPHREIAGAAGISHSTVKAVLTRSDEQRGRDSAREPAAALTAVVSE